MKKTGAIVRPIMLLLNGSVIDIVIRKKCDLHQEWSRIKNMEVHLETAIVTYTFQNETAEHRSRVTPSAIESNQNDLNEEQNSETTKITLVPMQIGNILNGSILHGAESGCTL